MRKGGRFQRGLEQRNTRAAPCVRSEKGVALFIVLWVLTLLSVIVGEFCRGMKTEVNITRNFKEETEAYYIAQAGVSRAISELVKSIVYLPKTPETVEGEPEETQEVWRANTDIPPVPFGRGQYKVEIGDESGRVDINSATPDLLKMALNGFELEEEQMEVIVDSIQDWRDADDSHRANGAENDYYQSLERPYKCKNGDFDDPEELLLVRGVTPEIFFGGLKDKVTVYGTQNQAATAQNFRLRRIRSRSDRVNINAAPPAVLLSLPLMTPELATAVVDFRKTAEIKSATDLVSIVGMDVYTAIQSYITFSGSNFYSVRSTGMPVGSRTITAIEVLVEINGAYEKAYRILEWREGVNAFEEQPEGGQSETASKGG